MATSTLRAIILAAAVALSVFGLARAFDGNPSAEVAGSPTTTPSPTVSVSPTGTSPTATSPGPTTSARPLSEVVVQVLNGTTIDGLATNVTDTLETAGYPTAEPGNYENTENTILYYQSGYEADAALLQQTYFAGALLEVAPDAFDPAVNITVILGADYNPT